MLLFSFSWCIANMQFDFQSNHAIVTHAVRSMSEIRLHLLKIMRLSFSFHL